MKLYPEHLPESVLNDPKRSAEVRVYETLAGLDGPYVVFYSVNWQARINGNTRDGEADFVIAHPELGILVIEVKGGGIDYDATSGEWTTTDRYGEVFKIDPIEQARKNHYTLLEKLIDLPGWDRNRFLTIGHAVCFPDIVNKDRFLRLDLPRSIVIDHDDLGNINTTIVDVFENYQNQSTFRQGELGKDRLAMVEGLLARSFKISTPLGVELELEDKRLVELTEQQFRLLDFLGNRRRALIAGCAGSGKTMLAIEKARQLSEQGFNVLLTCFNAALAENLAQRLPEITVLHFHGLCREMANRVGSVLRPYADEQEYNDKILPEALMNAIDDSDLRFDAIIVDEGQDFKENYWIALMGLISEKQGVFYVFYDDNQNLYGGAATLSGIIDEPPFMLSENCRNTQAIHKVVANFHNNCEALVCHGPAGRFPEFIQYKDSSQMLHFLQSMLYHLIEDEYIRAEDIVILTPYGQERTALKAGLRMGNFTITSNVPARRSEIQATSIYKFKGLERRVVIIAEIDTRFSYNTEMVMYVGCSRARTHLVLFAQENISPDLKKQIERLCAPSKSQWEFL